MVLFSACALCASLALAPTPSPTPSATPVSEIAHVYTSDRADVTLKNTARTIYVVTHDQIVRNGYRTVAQALADVPAMQISSFGPIGSSVNFTLRGSSSAQVLVLIDGLPAPGSFSNSVELGALPTNGVDRIEVVEGGGSTLYGTGAIGGVVNIITQRSANGGAMLRYGSFADREIDVRTPNVQFSRIVSNNGFSLPDGTVRSDVDYESSSLHGNLDRKIGSFDAALRAGIEADHTGAPGADSFLEPSARENDLNENADFSLTHNGAQSETTLQFGGTEQHIVFTCDLATDTNCALVGAGPSLSTEGRVNLGARNEVRGGSEQLLYGVDLSRGVVRSDDGFGDIATNALAQAAVYAQDRLDARWGNFYAGLRGERDGSLGGEISPSAGFVARLAPDASLKGNVATAFRAPNAAELYFPNFGNPNLKAERAKVADLTLTDTNILGGASVTWFGNRTNHLIEPDPVTFALAQIDHAFIEGLVFSVRTAPYNGFTTSLNFTDLYRAQNLDTEERLPNDPVISANLRLDYTAPASSTLDSFGVALRSAGNRAAVDLTASAFDQAVAYTNVDAYVRVRAGHDLLVSLRGFNLGNERYAAVRGYPLPGRSFALELSTK
jgi:vitamin B12 transporter